MRLFFWFMCFVLVVSCKKSSDSTSQQLQSPPPAPPVFTLQWQKTYGSSLNELGYAIAKSNDGSGYVFTASALGKSGDIASYHGGIGADVWVVKIDTARNIVWQQSLGGTNQDYANHIIATADGSGYVYVGETKSNDGDVTGNHGGYDLWVVKIDAATGAIVWQKTLGGSGYESPSLSTNSLIQTDDGGFLVAASTNSNDGDLIGDAHGGNDAWIIKLNARGDLVWQKTYGGSLNEIANCIIATSDGNYMVGATTNSTDGDLSSQVHHGGNDCWLFKINVKGDLLWQKTYGGSQDEGADGVLNTSDGGYVFSALTLSDNGDVPGTHGSADAWVVKIDGSGNIAWKKCFGGSGVDKAIVKNVDAQGRILLAGYTFSGDGDITNGYPGTEDMWVLLLDANGSKLYSSALGGILDDESADVVTTRDGAYLSIGRTGSTDGNVTYNHGGEDLWLVKFKF